MQRSARGGGAGERTLVKPTPVTAEFRSPRTTEPRDVLLPPGYRIEAVASGLTFPTGIAFDAQNRPHVVESGYSYGEAFTTARLVRVEPGGALTPVAGGDQVPWTGVAFHGGAFYVASGGQVPGKSQTGRILRVQPETGTVSTVLDGLPGHGDHHTNGPVAGPDGWLYFAQGTATNSGALCSPLAKSIVTSSSGTPSSSATVRTRFVHVECGLP